MAKQNSQVESLATIFRVLGDQTRLRALLALQRGELNVTELCGALRVPQPTISRHLGILRMAGLVNNRRSGKEIFYSVGGAQGDLKIVRSVLQAAAKM
jgi:ArsR family transcriptional regulator